MMITPEAILSAEERLRPHVRSTPLERSELLAGEGCDEVHLKLESNTIKLRHTLQHKLHPRLDQVTLEGSKIVRLHPAAFKVTADRSFANKVSAVSLQRLFGGF